MSAETSRRVIHGINAVASLLRSHADRVERVYIQEGLGAKRMSRLKDALAISRAEVENCSAERLETLVGTSKHQGVAALVRDSVRMSETEAREFISHLERPMLLVLDSVQDPRNFGACLRTANAAGADLVVTARNRNVGFTPAVSKVASGAAEAQPTVVVANLVRFLDFLKAQGVRIVGADAGATRNLFEADLEPPLAIVLGSEGSGLRRLTRESCDELVSLPMRGAVDSLNVSVAAGICLYECLRRRGE